MAEKKPRKSNALARLVPKATDITVDGHVITVAANKEENSILNMVLAAQMRTMLQEALKDYKDKGMLPTPKELRDLIEAGARVAEFSGEVYAASEPIEPIEKEAEKTDPGLVTFDTPAESAPLEVVDVK